MSKIKDINYQRNRHTCSLIPACGGNSGSGTDPVAVGAITRGVGECFRSKDHNI